MKYKKYLIDDRLKKTKHASIRLKNLQKKKYLEDSMKYYGSTSVQNRNSSSVLIVPSMDLISDNHKEIETSNIVNSSEDIFDDVFNEEISESLEHMPDSEHEDGGDFNFLLSG